MVTETTRVVAPSAPILRTNVNDPVGDMLTRIRNANLAYKDELWLPASKMNGALLAILRDEGYIETFAPEGEGVHQALRVRLKYARGRERVITGLKRISKPGRRVYARKDRLPRVLGGMGISILSTSNGLITSRTAAEQGVGGEVVCFVW